MILLVVAAAPAILYAATRPQAAVTVDQQQARQTTTRPQQEMTAVSEYDRLHQRFSELYDLADDDVREQFVLSGLTDEPMHRWLEAARPLSAELIAASNLPYGLQLDYSKGFGLLLPHLSKQRHLMKSARILAHDAALRGDTALALDLLRAQLAGTRRAGEDKLLISSLVSMGTAGIHLSTVDELLERGAFGPEDAKALAKSRDGLLPSMRGQLAAAIANETSMLVDELGRLATLGKDERAGVIGQAGLNGDIDLGDEALAKSREQAGSFRDAVRTATEKEDPAAMRVEFELLEARAAAGEFGDAVKLMAPNYARVLERFDRLELLIEEQDRILGDIASGAKPPSAFLNAARHYRIAAKAVESLGIEAQRTIDAVRTAADSMTESDRLESRRAVESLRAAVIDRIAKAAAIARCRFDDSSEYEPDLLPEDSAGALGALRIALLDPLLPGTRPADAPSAADACVAAAAAIRHFADGNGLGRALIAQRFSRDLATALRDLDAKGLLDDGARARLAKELDGLRPDDPFGIRRSIDLERDLLSGMHRGPARGSRADSPFSRERLAKLSPSSIAFLLGVLTSDRPALHRTPCKCPFDGPLLDVRGLFDLDALVSAQSQLTKLRTRFDADVGADQGIGASALQGLNASRPVDIEARIDEARADLERLRAFASAKAAPAATHAAPAAQAAP